jgi:hypothetical protein
MLPFVVVPAKVNGFHKKVDDNDGNKPSYVEIEKQNRSPEQQNARLMKNMNEGGIHHDDPQDKENNPCFLDMETF